MAENDLTGFAITSTIGESEKGMWDVITRRTML